MSLVLANIDDDTKIIPGHGPLTDKVGLQTYYDVLLDIDSLLRPLAERGLSLDEVKKIDPLEKYNSAYGNGFMSPDDFISIVYMDIKNNL